MDEDKFICDACGWEGADDEILSGNNPFHPFFTIYACPRCKAIEQFSFKNDTSEPLDDTKNARRDPSFA